MNITFKQITAEDFPCIEKWLYKPHVRRWYEIPEMNCTLDDWMSEITHFDTEYKWITYLIVIIDGHPIGMCLFYKSVLGSEYGEDFNGLNLDGAYSIDYLIGEESYIGKGIGKKMIGMVMTMISENTDAKKITADIDPRNAASAGVLKSCGFSLFSKDGRRYVYTLHAEK